MSEYPITNDSFLDLLDELRDELEMISTTNAMNPNAKVDDDIENAVTKCNEIVDVIAADLVAKHNTNTSGFTHISKALPTNTLNNDVLYIGINDCGFACVFNYLSVTNIPHRNITTYNCHYFTEEEPIHQMSDLAWWKILERPNYLDFNNEGFDANIQSNITNQTIDSNPYPKDSREYRSWRNGQLSADDLPF